MLFNSYEFIFVFLPIVVVGFFVISARWGKNGGIPWLALTSLGFYGYWDASYVPLLLLSILVNYNLGCRIASNGKNPLLVGIVFNLMLLGYFKYTDFFLSSVNDALGTNISLLGIVLPLGISFFTFTQIACLVDIYRRETKLDGFFSYLEFVTIFPHLIAGPIITHRLMQPQFMADSTYKVNWENMGKGLMLFSVGLFKKVCIADSISPWVGEFFGRADNLNFVEAWMAALGYTMQLYFDFSGYSEMAIGLALMINLKFPMNFDMPYRSLSIIEFWRRWHMTLGSWVKDYLYIPLGGNRQGEFKKMRNLLVSMLLIGLWHGAGWTFVVWGGLHGIYLVINHQWRRLNLQLPKAVAWVLTFMAVTCAWVLFRAENIGAAVAILIAMSDVQNIVLPAGGAWERYLGFLPQSLVHFQAWSSTKSLVSQLGTLGVCFVLIWLIGNPVHLVERAKPNVKTLILTVVLLISAVLGIAVQGASEFLYFQF